MYIDRKEGSRKKKEEDEKRKFQIPCETSAKRKLARSNRNQTKDDVKGNDRLEKDE